MPSAKVKFVAEALRGVGRLLLDDKVQQFVDSAPRVCDRKDLGERKISDPAHPQQQVDQVWTLEKHSPRSSAYPQPVILKKTFNDFDLAENLRKGMFAKKLDALYVAIMTPVPHYWVVSRLTRGRGCRWCASNRFGGSSSLGCVVFGRVAGDSAAAYILKNYGDVTSRAAARVAGVAAQLGAQPETAKKVIRDRRGCEAQQDDIWVIVDGQVLDMTKFLPDHLGGKKAILLFDAAEELFNMLHKPKVILRYAPDAVTERWMSSLRLLPVGGVFGLGSSMWTMFTLN
ncbi:hypothetical protein EDB84DRAFT_1599730 [Lactarius hengduanensis]|nr:hypothetical protein EDB84DRAFT_1599730 [Lactarius hengduanensis]